METRIYTAQEAGEMLGVTSQGIRKYCARNDVPRAGRTWQISESILAQMRTYYHATNAPDETKQEQAEKPTNETTVEPSIPERDAIGLLQEQLEAKDKQIQSLSESLSKALEQNSALTASLAETAKALATSKAFENASKALVANDAQTQDLSHYSPSGAPQKPSTFLSRLKWLIKG